MTTGFVKTDLKNRRRDLWHKVETKEWNSMSDRGTVSIFYVILRVNDILEIVDKSKVHRA